MNKHKVTASDIVYETDEINAIQALCRSVCHNGEGEHEYNVYLSAKITDEMLIEAKDRYEAETSAKELFLESLTGEQAINLITLSLEAEEVERAV